MKVKKISDSEGFSKMQRYWNSVLENSYSRFPFLTYEWLSSWWESFKEKRELYILEASEDEDTSPLGIAPLMLEKKFLFRIIKFIGSGPSDYQDFIISHKVEEVVKSFFSFLNQNRKSWDLIFLRDMVWTEGNIDRLIRKAGELGFEVYIKKSSVCPFLPVRSDWHKYISSKSAKFRYNRKREEERFQREGLKFQIHKINSYNYNQSIFEDIVEIERISWKSGTRAAKIQGESENIFYFNFLKEFACNDWLNIWIAYLNDRPIAYLINFDYKEKIWFYNTAYDERFKNYSVGSILIKRSLEDAFSSGKIEFDFLRGEENYKVMWASDKRQLFQIIIYRKKNFLSFISFFFLFRAKWALAKIKRILKSSL